MDISFEGLNWQTYPTSKSCSDGSNKANCTSIDRSTSGVSEFQEVLHTSLSDFESDVIDHDTHHKVLLVSENECREDLPGTTTTAAADEDSTKGNKEGFSFKRLVLSRVWSSPLKNDRNKNNIINSSFSDELQPKPVMKKPKRTSISPKRRTQILDNLNESMKHRKNQSFIFWKKLKNTLKSSFSHASRKSSFIREKATSSITSIKPKCCCYCISKERPAKLIFMKGYSSSPPLWLWGGANKKASSSSKKEHFSCWSKISKHELRALYGLVQASKLNCVKKQLSWISQTLSIISDESNRCNLYDRIRDSTIKGGGIQTCLDIIEAQTAVIVRLKRKKKFFGNNAEDKFKIKEVFESYTSDSSSSLCSTGSAVAAALPFSSWSNSKRSCTCNDYDDGKHHSDCWVCSLSLLWLSYCLLQELSLNAAGAAEFKKLKGPSVIINALNFLINFDENEEEATPRERDGVHRLELGCVSAVFRLVLATCIPMVLANEEEENRAPGVVLSPEACDSSQKWKETGIVKFALNCLNHLPECHQDTLVPFIGLALCVIRIIQTRRGVSSLQEAKETTSIAVHYLTNYLTSSFIAENSLALLMLGQKDFPEVTNYLLTQDKTKRVWELVVQCCQELRSDGGVICQAAQVLRYGCCRDLTLEQTENYKALLLKAGVHKLVEDFLPEQTDFESQRLFATFVYLKFFLNPYDFEADKTQSYVRVPKYSYVYNESGIDNLLKVLSAKKVRLPVEQGAKEKLPQEDTKNVLGDSSFGSSPKNTQPPEPEQRQDVRRAVKDSVESEGLATEPGSAITTTNENNKGTSTREEKLGAQEEDERRPTFQTEDSGAVSSNAQELETNGGTTANIGSELIKDEELEKNSDKIQEHGEANEHGLSIQEAYSLNNDDVRESQRGDENVLVADQQVLENASPENSSNIPLQFM